MSYEMREMIRNLEARAELEFKQNAEASANFEEYLKDLIFKFTTTPSDNLNQELQRVSCLELVKIILEKFTEIYTK